jgi:lysophospholipase L1-like esterase
MRVSATLVFILSLTLVSVAQIPPVPTGANVPVAVAPPVLIAPYDSRILIIGRYDLGDPEHPRLAYPGTSIRLRFSGSAPAVLLSSDTENSYVDVIVDGAAPRIEHLVKGPQRLVLAADLASGPHTAEIAKRTETWQGIITFSGIELATDSVLLDPPPLPRRRLMFIGDSVTCGSSIDRTADCKAGMYAPSNGYDAYGMLLARRLDAQAQLVCYGGRGVVRDYRGLRNVLNAPEFFTSAVPSDEPSARAGWPLDRYVPDAIVVSLGTNDFSLDKTDPIPHDEFVNKYVAFVRNIRKQYPKAIILLTEGAIVNDDPANEHHPLTTLRGYVRETVEKVADPNVRWVEAHHYPGDQCDPHPTRAEHFKIANDLEPVLRTALGW